MKKFVKISLTIVGGLAVLAGGIAGTKAIIKHSRAEKLAYSQMNTKIVETLNAEQELMLTQHRLLAVETSKDSGYFVDLYGVSSTEDKSAYYTTTTYSISEEMHAQLEKCKFSKKLYETVTQIAETSKPDKIELVQVKDIASLNNSMRQFREDKKHDHHQNFTYSVKDIVIDENAKTVQFTALSFYETKEDYTTTSFMYVDGNLVPIVQHNTDYFEILQNHKITINLTDEELIAVKNNNGEALDLFVKFCIGTKVKVELVETSKVNKDNVLKSETQSSVENEFVF